MQVLGLYSNYEESKDKLLKELHQATSLVTVIGVLRILSLVHPVKITRVMLGNLLTHSNDFFFNPSFMTEAEIITEYQYRIEAITEGAAMIEHYGYSVSENGEWILIKTVPSYFRNVEHVVCFSAPSTESAEELVQRRIIPFLNEV